MAASCVFCRIINGDAPAEKLWATRDEKLVVGIVPLNPVTAGHVLVMPRRHLSDALEDPEVTAYTMAAAARLARGSCNIITSVGAAATQTVFHLHVHVVPRRPGDGLALPWTNR